MGKIEELMAKNVELIQGDDANDIETLYRYKARDQSQQLGSN